MTCRAVPTLLARGIGASCSSCSFASSSSSSSFGATTPRQRPLFKGGEVERAFWMELRASSSRIEGNCISSSVEGRRKPADVKRSIAELKEALRLAVEFGKSLNDKEVKLTATRCFDVRTKTDVEGKTVEETKWAFAAMSHPPLTQAMCCLKGGGGPQSANAVLEGDSAPRSKAAKEMVPQRCFRRCRPASRSSREGCRISSSGRRRTTARSRAGTPSPGRSRPSNSWRSSGTRPRAKRPGVAAPVLHLPLPLPLDSPKSPALRAATLLRGAGRE
ncbi:unnamed protein product [Prorocentrum cordatum]|uniref:Uncharacterized protein n=1 Tax=Prorocentrum cordatum TaxID=2364126 RepID=A0ABN9QPF8_9DINO|nr:unnamed protein product [Polarella glacialis]